MLYLAYGSNLNKNQMAFRCPKAKPLGAFMMPNWRLVFRGVADIMPEENAQVPIGLWEITDECEKALDRYEGVPRLYRKQYFTKKTKLGIVRYLTYIMNTDTFALPSINYFESIQEGYKDFFGKDESASKLLTDSLLFTKQAKPMGFGGHTPMRFKNDPIKYPE
tara:strand:+ start:624 stop:1115 length:492 start_codon:yes stop_codon:yes gene_type:complete